MTFYRLSYTDLSTNEENHFYCIGNRRLGKEIAELMNEWIEHEFSIEHLYQINEVTKIVKTWDTFKKCLCGYRKFNII